MITKRHLVKARVIGVCLLAAASTLVAAENVELEPRSLLDGKLQVLIPTHFRPMGEEMLRIKYPSEQRPTTVFTNERGSVNVALNHTQHAISTEQLGEAREAFDQMFRSRYPSATWYRSELTSLNGHDCFVLELLTPAIDTQIHNIMVGIPLENRLLLVSVNLTKELEAQWLPTAQRIIESITITQ